MLYKIGEYIYILRLISYADMAELVDALDLGSSAHKCAGSSPAIRNLSMIQV